MKHIRCKVCGAEHRLGDSHVWRTGPGDAAASEGSGVSGGRGHADADPGGNAAAVGRVVSSSGGGGTSPAWDTPPEVAEPGRADKGGKDGFDRVAYQREYMRKRRATERERKVKK